MDKSNLRLSGKLEANGNGTIANRSIKLTALTKPKPTHKHNSKHGQG